MNSYSLIHFSLVFSHLPWYAPTTRFLCSLPFWRLNIWETYFSLLKIFLAIWFASSFLLMISVPAPLCWYYSLPFITSSLHLFVICTSDMFLITLFWLLPVSKNTPMSLSWISLFKFLSLCLLALLEGYPLQFQKRILVIWLPDYLNLLSVLLSHSSESFNPNPRNALLGATSSSSICLSHSMPLLIPVSGRFYSLTTSSTSIFSIFVK